MKIHVEIDTWPRLAQMDKRLRSFLIVPPSSSGKRQHSWHHKSIGTMSGGAGTQRIIPLEEGWNEEIKHKVRFKDRGIFSHS